MTKYPDARWDEASDPEISVTAVLPAAPEDPKNRNIVGERFGKYLLVGEIAAGGMAELFLAVHKGLEGFLKVVVIKRVLPHFTSHDQFVRMFIDEARLAARLEHQNIVRTYEFGEDHGQYFTAMEFLPGEDLCKTLNKLSFSRQVVPLSIAAGIASQVCAGLHFAHQLTDIDGRPLNLVHRDINPANIILTYGGEVKIIDFGVAKTDMNERTVTGTIKGKVAYMPPEQVLGRGVDQRADIFSAGVVLWEMLTGRPLFLRDSEAATLYAIMNAPIPPPSKFRPEVPPQLDKIVARALARHPGDRYDTAEEMGATLEDFMAHDRRFDARVLARMMEEMFGSTCADAKRSIAQTRSLTRNISLVMKLRSDVRTDLAVQLDAVSLEGGTDDQTARNTQSASGGPATAAAIAAGEQQPSHRRVLLALVAVMLACIVAGVVYMMPRSESGSVSKPIVQTVLQIDSVPPGAAVFVGGEPTGLKTPATLTGITARQLPIRLELAGHVPATQNIEVAPGTTLYKQITLTASPTRLIISGLPVNASVFVDDDEHSAGEVIQVNAGKHVVRIVADGRVVTQQSLETTSGDQGWRLVHGKLVSN